MMERCLPEWIVWILKVMKRKRRYMEVWMSILSWFLLRRNFFRLWMIMKKDILFLIEKSKREMIAEDLRAALGVIGHHPR